MVNIKQLEHLLRTLANRRRLAILECLKKRKEMNVGEIAKEIKLSFTSTSKHLRLLERAGVLDKDQRGLVVYYSITPEIGRVAKFMIGEL